MVDASADNMEAHEQTVLSLLNELDMGDIPALTVYNKRDLAEGPIKASLYPNCIISAIKEEDIESLKEKIAEEMRKMLEPYQLEIPSQRGDILVQLRKQTLLDRQLFDEETQLYFVEGYAKKESKWTKN